MDVVTSQLSQRHRSVGVPHHWPSAATPARSNRALQPGHEALENEQDVPLTQHLV